MAARLIRYMENMKDPAEVISFFESEMVEEELIANKLDILTSGPKRSMKRLLYWWSVQMLYFVFFIRAGLLFLLPILDPGNTVIPLVLGDGIAVLGMAVRQMWHSLALNYSILFATIRFTVWWAERNGKLHFMTNFTPEWGSKPEQQRIRFELNLCYIGYKYFNNVIYATIASNMGVYLFLDTMARRSVTHFWFNLFWIVYNCFWISFGPTVVIQLFVFMRLATIDASHRLHRVHADGQQVLRLGLQDRAPHELRKKMAKLVSGFEAVRSEVAGNNECMKFFFMLFRCLFIPIAACNCYVLFTGTFPNLFSRIIVLTLSLNQLAMIYCFMALAAIPHKKSLPVANVTFSILVRMRDRLSVQQKITLLNIIKKITSTNDPLGYTCGNTFPFEGRSMMDFVLEIGSAAILSMQMITKISGGGAQ